RRDAEFAEKSDPRTDLKIGHYISKPKSTIRSDCATGRRNRLPFRQRGRYSLATFVAFAFINDSEPNQPLHQPSGRGTTCDPRKETTARWRALWRALRRTRGFASLRRQRDPRTRPRQIRARAHRHRQGRPLAGRRRRRQNAAGHPEGWAARDAYGGSDGSCAGAAGPRRGSTALRRDVP